MLDVIFDMANTCEYVTDVVCGPYAYEGETCCFEIMTQDDGCTVPGRPFMVANTATTARPITSDSWCDNNLNLTNLPQAQHAELVEQWTAHALAEHASVASFAQFALELMAVGAPADLVEDAHKAALDEVRHARMAFEIASELRAADGQPAVGPSAITMAPLPTTTLVDLAVATVKEGCINETLSAMLLAEQLNNATHPQVRKVLATMVADETRHAELAWRTVSWAIRLGGKSVLQAVRGAFDQAVVPQAPQHNLSGEALGAAPAPTPRDALRIMAGGLAEVVLPCAHALFANVEMTTVAVAPTTAHAPRA